MAHPELTVGLRDKLGRGPSFKTRQKGLIPAVLYGPKLKKAITLTLDPLMLVKTLKTYGGFNTLMQLSGDKTLEGKVVLVKDLQRNPVNQAVIHADLYEVDLAKKVVVNIPVQLIGKPKGIEEGGVLQQTRREIAVECPVTEIPKQVELDVSALGIGDSLHVEDIILPANVKAVYEENYAIASVVPPAKEEVVTPVAAAPVEGEEAAAVGAEGEKKEGEEKKEAGKGEAGKGESGKKEAGKKETGKKESGKKEPGKKE